MPVGADVNPERAGGRGPHLRPAGAAHQKSRFPSECQRDAVNSALEKSRAFLKDKNGIAAKLYHIQTKNIIDIQSRIGDLLYVGHPKEKLGKEAALSLSRTK